MAKRTQKKPKKKIARKESVMAKNSAKEERASVNPNDSIQRNILPIPDRKHVGLTTYDAKDPNTKYPPIEPLRPPKGAPNVLIILIDDVGFGASSAFGGPCNTPIAERLAAGGLKYNRFHTTALCRRPARRCSPAAIIIRSAWERSLRWPLRRRATTASGPRRKRRSRKS